MSVLFSMSNPQTMLLTWIAPWLDVYHDQLVSAVCWLVWKLVIPRPPRSQKWGQKKPQEGSVSFVLHPIQRQRVCRWHGEDTKAVPEGGRDAGSARTGISKNWQTSAQSHASNTAMVRDFVKMCEKGCLCFSANIGVYSQQPVSMDPNLRSISSNVMINLHQQYLVPFFTTVLMQTPSTGRFICV